MDKVVVYKAGVENYISVVQALKEEGFDAVALENPYSPAIYLGSGGYSGYYRSPSVIYIAVPREDEIDAKKFLQLREMKFQKQQDENVAKLTSQLWRIGFWWVLIMLPIGCAIIFWRNELLKLLLPIIGLGILLAIANADSLRKLFKKKDENKTAEHEFGGIGNFDEKTWRKMKDRRK